MKMPDVNVLVAATVENHVHHRQAVAWVKKNRRFATCPITELGVLRVLMQLGATADDAHLALSDLVSRHRESLVPADISATRIAGLAHGHRQTTDAYLVQLASEHGLKLATLDSSLAKRFRRATERVRVS